MVTQRIKIISRLRPRIKGELDDNSVKIVHELDDSGESFATTKGGSFVTVPNPRDAIQIFKFPLVSFYIRVGVLMLRVHSFSNSYDEDSTQEEIYHNDVEPLIDIV